MNTLARLQAWYAQQCDGDWEHSFGVSIQSCDNPGWWVKINLAGTTLQTRCFAEIKEGVDDKRIPLGPDWLCCYTADDTWHGASDAAKLERILEVFLAWAGSGDH